MAEVTELRHEHVLGVAGHVHDLDLLLKDVAGQEAEREVRHEDARLVGSRQLHFTADSFEEDGGVGGEHGREVGGTRLQHADHVVGPVVA